MSIESEIEINKDKNILKQLIEKDVKIYFGCMGGSCGACACDVIKGREFINSEALKKPVFSGLESNQILVCISKLKKDNNEVIELKKRL